VQALFPSFLILLGTALGIWAWRAGGLPVTPADRALDLCFTDEQRVALDITLSFVVVAMGIVAAVA
jgi:hypothetical protein